MESRGFESFLRCFWPSGFNITNVRSKDVKLHETLPWLKPIENIAIFLKKEDAAFETIPQGDAERSITSWSISENKDQKCYCLFFVLITVYHLGKTTDRREDQDLSVKIHTGLEVMAPHRISGQSLDLLTSLLPHENHTPVWLLMASRLMLPTYVLYTVRANLKLTVFAENSRLFPFLSHLTQNSLSDGTSVAIQYTVILCLCN